VYCSGCPMPGFLEPVYCIGCPIKYTCVVLAFPIHSFGQLCIVLEGQSHQYLSNTSRIGVVLVGQYTEIFFCVLYSARQHVNQKMWYCIANPIQYRYNVAPCSTSFLRYVTRRYNYIYCNGCSVACSHSCPQEPGNCVHLPS
jgi:hypothetical protein